ncbi:MAG: hypothetical protein QXH91_05945 [Candidatus Bathyarchaeia archaeon]
MERELSFKYPPVKAHTLLFAPEDWFSVRDYLKRLAEDIDPKLFGEGKILELAEGHLPSEKTLSMRLFRYFRQGLLERKRVGHQFLYRVTEKGLRRGMYLEKPESIYEYISHYRKRTTSKKTFSLTSFKAFPSFIFKPITSSQKFDEILLKKPFCRHCGQTLPNADTIVCPKCHKLV